MTEFHVPQAGLGRPAPNRPVSAGAVVAEWLLDHADMVRDTVQTKPFMALGIVAASSLLAGAVLGRLARI